MRQYIQVHERRLWCAVIWQWSQDIRLCIQHQRYDLLRRLLKWLSGQDFEKVCELAGVSPDAVRYETSRLLKRHGIGDTMTP
jgi:hypothetical protein